MKRSILTAFLVGLFVVIFAQIAFAQTNREKGIELYKQGKDKEAIVALEAALKTEKNAADLLNLLGMAYSNLDNLKEAHKALEKAVKVEPQNPTYRSNLAVVYIRDRKINKAQREIEIAIRIDPNNANAWFIRATSYFWEQKYDQVISNTDKVIELNRDFLDAYILKSEALLLAFGREWLDENEPSESLHLLVNARGALNNCKGDCLKQNGSNRIAEKLESINGFLKYFEEKRKNNVVETDANNSTPVKFVSKPPPHYTDAARQALELGKVELAILFGSDGTVKHIIVIKGLNYGLTEEATKAASKIIFEPATRAGKPVSVVKRVIYSFDVR